MTNYRKPKRRISKFRLDETSTVDRPAHAPATIAIMKRAPEFTKKLAVTTLADGHAHTIIMVQAGSEGMGELRAGQTSWTDGHVHDWIMDEAGNIIIADANAHTHGLAALVTKNDETLDAGVLAALAQTEQPASITKGADSAAEDSNMTPEEKAAFEKAAADKLNIEKARAERAEQIVSLSPDQRAHFDGLAKSEQDEFLATADKDAIVKNAADANGVVYTADNGDVFRKNDDPRLLKMAQERDADRRELVKERELRKGDELRKRAGELLKNCSGSDDVKGALLGAVEGIADETMRKGALAILTAKDAGLQKAFETIGDGADQTELPDAEVELNKLAKAKQEASPGLTFEKAYVAVLATPEGRKLAEAGRA